MRLPSILTLEIKSYSHSEVGEYYQPHKNGKRYPPDENGKSLQAHENGQTQTKFL